MLKSDVYSSNSRLCICTVSGPEERTCRRLSRLFSLLGYSSSGSVQMPKSSIVWPHSNKTIVLSGSVLACAESQQFMCGVVLVHVTVALCVCCTCITLKRLCVRLHFPGQGVRLLVQNHMVSHWNAAGPPQPKHDPVFRLLKSGALSVAVSEG